MKNRDQVIKRTSNPHLVIDARNTVYVAKCKWGLYYAFKVEPFIKEQKTTPFLGALAII